MSSLRRAVIDVGTNSVKLLVAEVAGHHVRPLWEESKQTRLGEGFYETHQLQREAIHATAYFAAEFAQIARSYKTERVRLIATSAARDALNRAELLEALEQKTGLKPEVISGEREAELAYQGVISDPSLDGPRLCLMEVGGGSAQLMVGQGPNREFATSFKLGALRLMEQFPPSDSPQPAELSRCRDWLAGVMAREILPVLTPVLAAAPERPLFIGTGGTAKSLLRMESTLNAREQERLEAEGIPLAVVTGWVESLWRLPLSERKRLLGLKKKRADVVPFGAVIFEAALRGLGFTHLRVSKRGVRHAILFEAPAPV